MTAARHPPGAARHSDTAEQLTHEAIEISAMAEELSARGLQAEAVTFALAAAERLRAVRAAGHELPDNRGTELGAPGLTLARGWKAPNRRTDSISVSPPAAPPEHPTPAMIEAGVRMHLTLRGGPDETLVHDIWQSMYHAWLAGER